MGIKNNNTQAGNFKQITEQERHIIAHLLKNKFKISAIAEQLSKDRRTIEREIKRGMVIQRDTNWKENLVYTAQYAQEVHKKAAARKGRKHKLLSEPKLVEYIREKIKTEHFSPDAAIGCLRLNNKTTICTKTVYNAIDDGIIPNLANSDLPQKKEKRKRKKRDNRKAAYNNIKGNSIDNRPKEANARDINHWEIDSVLSGKGSKACLIVLTERHSRLEMIIKAETHSQKCVLDAINALELEYKELFPCIFQSITADNGPEFLNQNLMESSILYENTKRTAIYYAHPYCSWERGSNEVANKLIRRFIKKGANIDDFTDKDIHDIQVWMNNYPRRIFGYKSAAQIYYEATKIMLGI